MKYKNKLKVCQGKKNLFMNIIKKNPSATQHLHSTIYEEKIIKFIKSKINLSQKELSIKEAEILINKFNENNNEKTSTKVKKKKLNLTRQKN